MKVPVYSCFSITVQHLDKCSCLARSILYFLLLWFDSSNIWHQWIWAEGNRRGSVCSPPSSHLYPLGRLQFWQWLKLSTSNNSSLIIPISQLALLAGLVAPPSFLIFQESIMNCSKTSPQVLYHHLVGSLCFSHIPVNSFIIPFSTSNPFNVSSVSYCDPN